MVYVDPLKVLQLQGESVRRDSYKYVHNRCWLIADTHKELLVFKRSLLNFNPKLKVEPQPVRFPCAVISSIVREAAINLGATEVSDKEAMELFNKFRRNSLFEVATPEQIAAFGSDIAR